MNSDTPWADPALSDQERVSLCETLDRVLTKGVVVAGEIIISVADVDLIYVGLQLILTSVETARRLRASPTVHLGARVEGRA